MAEVGKGRVAGGKEVEAAHALLWPVMEVDLVVLWGPAAGEEGRR